MKRCIVLTVTVLLVLATSAWAVRTTLTHSTYSVTTSSGQAFASSVNRNYLLLQNDSNQRLYCKFNATAVLNEGITLAAQGTVGDTMEWFERVPTTALNCIHGGTGSKVLLIAQGVQ